MSLFPKKIAWTEPWSLEEAKARLAQARKELPPLWRMIFYTVGLPVLIGVGFVAFCPAVEAAELRLVAIGVAGSSFVSVVVFAVLYFSVMLPMYVCVSSDGVYFAGSFTIAAKNITALSFETRNGKRYFVVRAKTRNDVPYERRALLPAKKVTERDIVSFLYEVNLAHLVVESNLADPLPHRSGGGSRPRGAFFLV